MKLDYSALNQPVTQADLDAYGIVYKETVFTVPKSLRTIGIVLAIAAAGLCVGLIASGMGQLFVVLIQLAIGIAIVVAFVQASQVRIRRRAKVYKFALANDAQFIVNVAEPGYAGAIFNHGKDRSIVDGVVFPDGTEIGNFMYITGSGRSAAEHHWGYVRVKLKRRLPHMLLDAKSNNILGMISNLPESFRKQTLSLEGDFDKYFTLYVPDGYQRDALYVLTPDVMAALIDAGKNYDIEIIDDELFIYGPALDLGLQSTVESLMNVVNRIGNEVRDQSDRYSDERAPARAANVVAEPGRRLRKRVNLLKIAATTAIVAYMLYSLISTNFS